MHSWQNAFLVLGFYLENLFMYVTFLLKGTVSLPTIGHNSTPGNNIGFDERYKLISRAIIDYLKPDAAQFFASLFSCYHNSKLMFCTTASFPAVPPTNINFVNFNLAEKFFPAITNRTTSKLMKPGPCGIITAESKERLESKCVDSCFSCCKPPQCFEPQGQFFARTVKNCTCGKRMIKFTVCTDEKFSVTQPIVSMSASGADKAIGPSILKKIIIASVFIVKSFIKFDFIHRKIFCNKKRFHVLASFEWLFEASIPPHVCGFGHT